MSALFVRHRPPCRKKSILAEVCFDAKKGQLCMQAKCIFIYTDRHLHPFLGDLQQNAVRFDAKHGAICR